MSCIDHINKLLLLIKEIRKGFFFLVGGRFSLECDKRHVVCVKIVIRLPAVVLELETVCRWQNGSIINTGVCHCILRLCMHNHEPPYPLSKFANEVLNFFFGSNRNNLLCTSTAKISMTSLLEILIPQNASTRTVYDLRL